MRSVTWSVVSPPRSASGLSWMKTLPVLVAPPRGPPPPPPIVPVTVATAGSSLTIFMNWANFCFISWKEIEGPARIMPNAWPVSSLGKNPLGT